MAPHIVSWGANAPAASPASSSSASVVSFESITSEIPPTKVPEDATETGTNPVNSSTGEPRSLTPTSTYPGMDDSFQRHDTYFFKDGNITFLVDGTLYCVHRYFFSRDSVYFSSRLAQLGARDHEALTTVVSLGDVEREDFEAFLSVIYPEDFEEHNLSYQQWKSVLHLSTRWGFASIRKLALKSIKPPTPHDRLILARTYAIYQWVLPALTALCERAEALSLTEARQMRLDDVILVAAVREKVRDCCFIQTDTARVTQAVQAALAGVLPRNDDNSASDTGPEGEAADQGTNSTTAALPTGVRQEDGTQNSGSKFSSLWKGKGVEKSLEENATQGAPKPEGEQDPKPFSGSFFGSFGTAAPVGSAFSSTAAKTTTSKQKPPKGKQATKGQSPFGGRFEIPSTSTVETPKLATFSFGFSQGSAAAPSPSSGTPLRPAGTSSPSPEPTPKKVKTPGDKSADSKAPAK